MLLLTLFPYGPVHVALTFGSDALMRRIRASTDSACDHARAASKSGFSLRAWIAFFTVACLALGWPFAYRSLVMRTERQSAVAAAKQDWALREPVVFRAYEDDILVGDIRVEYSVDPATGFILRHMMSDLGYRDAYNTAIGELVRDHGVPDWSLKAHVPAPDEVAAILDLGDYQEVTSFPHEVNSSIVLMRGGNITRWGSTMSSGDNSLTVATVFGMVGIGDGLQRAYVRRQGLLTFIRSGTTWAGIFYKDGRLIASASRF